MVNYRMTSFFRVGAANLWKKIEKQTTGYNGIQFNTFQPFFSPHFVFLPPKKWQDWPKLNPPHPNLSDISQINSKRNPTVEPLSPSVNIKNPAANVKKMQLKCSLIRKCCAVRDEGTKSSSQLPVPLHVIQV